MRGPGDSMAELTVGDGPAASEPSHGRAAGPVGSHIGRYLVIDEIGVGGMGRVFRAYDPKLSREVAVKQLRIHGSVGRARMLREAKAMAQLSHPNVVPVYDVDIDEDDVAIAMEYVEGETLRDWLARGPHSWRAVLDTFIDAGRGLAAAHAQGILHRDFKPANVIVGKDGRVRVMDFGLARAVDAAPLDDGDASDAAASATASDLSAALTEHGTVMGTPMYMAPEQHLAGNTDRRTDQYAFCTALWEGLFGEPPFVGTTITELAIAKRRGQPKPPAGAGVPSAVQAITQRGLAFDPDARWPDMDALLAALRRASARRRPWLALGAAGIVAAASAFAIAARDAPCTGGEAEIAGTWGSDSREGVHEALLASHAGYASSTWDRVAIALDDYAREWAFMHREACESAKVRHEQSDEALDLRMQCLATRKHELGAVVELLQHSDAETTQNAIELVVALTPITRCADVAALREQSPPPSRAADVASVRAQIEQSRLEQYAGHVEPALATAEAAEEAAEPLAYPPVLAEAELRLGTTLALLDRNTEAQPLLEHAMQTALAHRQTHTAAAAAVELSGLITGMHGRPDASQWLAKVALGLAEGDGTDEPLIAEASLQMGYVYADQQLELQAEPYFRGAVERLERALGPDHPELVGPLLSWSEMLTALNRYPEADLAVRRALALAEASFGPDHPQTATALTKLAWLEIMAKRYPEAEAAFDRALAIDQAAFGSQHHTVWGVLGSRAAALAEQKKYDAASADLEHALRLMEAQLSADHPSRANALHNLARVQALKGDHQRAAELFTRAVAIRRRLDVKRELVAGLGALGGELVELGRLTDAEHVLEEAAAIDAEIHADDGLRSGTALMELGKLARLRGNLEKARGLLETAWSYERDAPAVERQAESAFVLGQTLWELGVEKARGRKLIETAQELASDDEGESARPIKEAIDAWLAEHPPGLRIDG